MPAARFKWIRGARSEATEREGTVGSFCSLGNGRISDSSAPYRNDLTGFVGFACVLLFVITTFFCSFIYSLVCTCCSSNIETDFESQPVMSTISLTVSKKTGFS